MKFIPINKPMLAEQEKKAVMKVLETALLTDASYEGGKMVREFERKLRKLLGVRHVIAVNSGTAALHASLAALGVSTSSEVILPSFTFAATANVVRALGAKPVFVDTKNDYNISPPQVAASITKKTKAIIPVHLYGYPADLDEIHEIASKHSVAVVEDAAESVGAKYRGKQTGSTSEFGCFSLYAPKVVTAGEGGAISTNSDDLADKVRKMRNHGMVEGYDTRMLGYNYRMPEVSAAIASVQMDRLSTFISIRNRNVSRLAETAEALKGVKFTQKAKDRSHVWYLYTLFLSRRRDLILATLWKKGIGAAVYFKMPVHKTPYYAELGYSKLKLPITESASRHVLSLPVHPAVSDLDIDYIAREFEISVKRTV
jgi:dTDP-4-amino-4,6-dideoxygalactose transaminase